MLYISNLKYGETEFLLELQKLMINSPNLHSPISYDLTREIM
jgi:hypothetical protein